MDSDKIFHIQPVLEIAPDVTMLKGVQLQRNQVFEYRNLHRRTKHFPRNPGGQNGVEGGIDHQHQVHGPCARLWWGKLDKGIPFFMDIVSHLREQSQPPWTVITANQEVQIRSISRVTMEDHRQTTNDQEIQLVF